MIKILQGSAVTETMIDRLTIYSPAANLLYIHKYIHTYPPVASVQGGPKKSKPDSFRNNFVNCQPIFIIFGTYTL